MIKRYIAIFSLMILAVLPAFSQDTTQWQIGISVQYTKSYNFAHISTDIFTIFGIENSGIGLGMKTYLGLDYDAIFLGAYFRAELGWFYFGVSPLFLLVQPDNPAIEIITNAVSMLVFRGVALPIVESDHDKLVAIANLEASITPFPFVDLNTGNFASDIIIGLLSSITNAMFNTVKFNVGLGYYHYF